VLDDEAVLRVEERDERVDHGDDRRRRVAAAVDEEAQDLPDEIGVAGVDEAHDLRGISGIALAIAPKKVPIAAVRASIGPRRHIAPRSLPTGAG
jgi:hypothetical protein